MMHVYAQRRAGQQLPLLLCCWATHNTRCLRRCLRRTSSILYYIAVMSWQSVKLLTSLHFVAVCKLGLKFQAVENIAELFHVIHKFVETAKVWSGCRPCKIANLPQITDCGKFFNLGWTLQAVGRLQTYLAARTSHKKPQIYVATHVSANCKSALGCRLWKNESHQINWTIKPLEKTEEPGLSQKGSKITI